MFSGFLHGIEIIETTVGPLPVTVVRSAVIGLVGTAPTFAAPTRPSWYTVPTDGVVPAWCVGDSAAATWPLWNQSAVINVDEIVIDQNGNVQQCTVAGTSDVTPPTWGTVLNDLTTDNDVTWKLVQTSTQLRQQNQLVLVNGPTDASGFGPKVRGYTIPYALRAIQLQGAGQVLVVNVFDRNNHTTDIATETHTLPATGVQKVAVGHMGISNVLVKDDTDVTTYELGSDFSVDFVNGVVYQLTGGAITDNQTLHISYRYSDPTGANGVVNSDVIGVAGPPATGSELFRYAKGQLGFGPKILIAPGFSYAKTVADQLISLGGSTAIRAIALIDSPGGLSPATGGQDMPQVSQDAFVQTPAVIDTLDSRSDLTAAFSASNERAVLAYPNMLFDDDGVDPTGATVLDIPTDGPYSAWYAGAIAANDLKSGYWDSPSNIVMLGPLGGDVPMIMSSSDPFSDSNTLNAAGVVTVFSSFGTGLRVWGNHSSAFPTSTKPQTFIAIRRTLDVIEESLEDFSLQFLDRPISNALIQAILQSVNGFIDLQIQRGALVPGSRITYDVNDNPPVQLAAGQIVFAVDLMPPPPAERITYNFHVNTELLKNITG